LKDPTKSQTKHHKKALLSLFEHLVQMKLKLARNRSITRDLLQFEKAHVVTHMKIGVLLCLEGQTEEEQMFSNEKSTKALDEFLNFLGDEVVLQGFIGYSGGLDTKTNHTGITSIHTHFAGLSIMFHVSTLLPHSRVEPQQLEKKCHIGNDIVVIIFNESTSTPFSPQTIKSDFNQVYAIIQPFEASAKGISQYRLSFASKDGVPLFGPLIPEPNIFEKGPRFRQFLLTKLINGERAAYDTPAFYNKLTRTRRVMLQEMAQKYSKKA